MSENTTTPDAGQSFDEATEEEREAERYLLWFRESKTPDRAMLKHVLSAGLGFPAGAFRQIACDLAILGHAALDTEAGFNREILEYAFLGIETRARAAAGLLEREHEEQAATHPTGADDLRTAIGELKEAAGSLAVKVSGQPYAEDVESLAQSLVEVWRELTPAEGGES